MIAMMMVETTVVTDESTANTTTADVAHFMANTVATDTVIVADIRDQPLSYADWD
jgi:hypothetical protein